MVQVQPAFAVPNPWINPPPPVNVTFGGVLEPLNPRGSRLQMTYREDDFNLEYTDAAHLNLDLEQLHWASWNNTPVQFDSFDRVTIEAAHSDVRPDLTFQQVCPDGTIPDPINNPGCTDANMMAVAPNCNLDCASMVSGLSPTFANNVLQGSSLQTLVKDRVYQINPNSAFSNPTTGTIFVPYADFEQTYTWRDSRLVSWDMTSDRAIGLGGAKSPDGTPPARDRTAFISSPWIPEEIPTGSSYVGNPSIWTVSNGDFRGDRVRDHDPIAMPLLLDFKVYADDPANGVARGANSAHIGYIGPCWTSTLSGNGYYNFSPLISLCGLDWPVTRVHTSGGIDGGTLQENFVLDPGNETVATGGWILDAGLGDASFGLYRTGPGDDHVHWAQADLVRKVSLVTFGFFDTTRPNQHDFPASFQSNWPGLTDKAGFPDMQGLEMRRAGSEYGVDDLVSVVDPPLSRVPGGTSITIEYRGAEDFERSQPDPAMLFPVPHIYDPANDDNMATRGNLLNPNYACEAYRYATPNSGSGKSQPRIKASGLTPYVEEDQIDVIRDPLSHMLPRFINMRIVFENDTDSTPPVSPKLRSFGVVYRMKQR